MDTTELANRFVALCKAGRFDEAGETFWAEGIVSVEPMEGEMARLQGKAAVRGEGEWWYADHEIHRAEAHGPYVNGDQSVARFDLDVTPRATGQRMRMQEIGLYNVRDGRIAEERFFTGTG